jgi:hypothetical protein
MQLYIFNTRYWSSILNDCVKEIVFSWKECNLGIEIYYQRSIGTYFDDTVAGD